MQVVITVEGDQLGGADADDLRGWLDSQPALRGRIRRNIGSAPQRGTMGLAADALLALLAPGGVATVLAGAVIAWVQARKISRTVIITRPDGAQVQLTSTQVGALDAQQVEELAQRIAADLASASSERDALPEPPAGPESAARPSTR